jgi:hypothetical protein
VRKEEFVRIRKGAVQIYESYISSCDVGVLRKTKNTPKVNYIYFQRQNYITFCNDSKYE